MASSLVNTLKLTSRPVLKRVLGFIVWFVIVSVSIDAAVAQKEKQSESDAWFTTVKPGIKRYGKIPEFAEVGQSQSFEVSPDAETLIFVSGQKLKFWDIEAGKVREEITLESHASLMEYSNDGLSLYLAGWNQKSGGSIIYVHDGITGQFKHQIAPGELVDQEELNANVQLQGTPNPDQKIPFHIQQMAVSPQDNKLLVNNGSLTIILDPESKEKICSLKPNRWSQTIAFSPDGKSLLHGSGETYDANTGEKDDSNSIEKLGRNLSKIATHPRKNVVATASWNSGLSLYDFDKKQKIELEKPDGQNQTYLVEFSGNGKMVAAIIRSLNSGNTKTNQKIVVWDLESRKVRNQIDIPAGHLSKLRFSADDKEIYTKFNTQFGISKWNIDQKQSKEKPLQGHTSHIRTMKFMDDGDSLVSLDIAGTGFVFDLDSGEPSQQIHCQNATHIATSSNSQFTVIAANYQQLTILNNKTKKTKHIQVRSYKPPSAVSRFKQMLSGSSNNGQNWENFAISDITISDDDEHVLIAMRGRQLFRLTPYELSSGKKLDHQRFKMKNFWSIPDANQPRSMGQWNARSMTASSDRQLVGIISPDKDLFVIDAESKAIVHELGKLEGHAPAIQFTPDSSRLVAVANQLKIWDMETGEEVETPDNTSGRITSFAINTKGDRMATLAANKATLFDLETGEQLFEQKPDFGAVAVAVSDDGKKLALARQNSQFEVWELSKLK